MVKRYTTIPRYNRQNMNVKASSVYDPHFDEYAYTADVVFEEDNYPVFTGLLDEKGDEIYSANVKDPIGFWLGSSEDSV